MLVELALHLLRIESIFHLISNINAKCVFQALFFWANASNAHHWTDAAECIQIIRFQGISIDSFHCAHNFVQYFERRFQSIHVQQQQKQQQQQSHQQWTNSLLCLNYKLRRDSIYADQLTINKLSHSIHGTLH